jgi:hypothetical protein
VTRGGAPSRLPGAQDLLPGQEGALEGASRPALLRSLHRAGLVDELRLFLHPAVVGSGLRLFGSGETVGALKLSDCRSYDNGVVSLTHEPAER